MTGRLWRWKWTRNRVCRVLLSLRFAAKAPAWAFSQQRERRQGQPGGGGIHRRRQRLPATTFDVGGAHLRRSSGVVQPLIIRTAIIRAEVGPSNSQRTASFCLEFIACCRFHWELEVKLEACKIRPARSRPNARHLTITIQRYQDNKRHVGLLD